jgi:hypothetical protein
MTTTIDKERNYFFTNNTDTPDDYFDMEMVKEFLDHLGSPDYRDTHLTMVKGEAIVNSTPEGSLQIIYKATYKWDPELEPLTPESILSYIFDLKECLEDYEEDSLLDHAKFEITGENTLTLQVEVLG